MATSLQTLVCDASTLSNFTQWAQAISTFIGGTAGWTKSSDTGQVNWGTISSLPAVNTFVYEMWEPNDSLSNFLFKIEYGRTASGGPQIQVTIGTASDGAGNLVSTVVGPFITRAGDWSGAGTSPYECRFSGEPGRLSIMMWRLGASGSTQCFGVERSINASGAYTSTHVTLMVGASVGGTSRQAWGQQTLHFTLGAAPPASLPNTWGGQAGGMPACVAAWGVSVSGSFNNSIPFDTTKPVIGLFDYPLTSFGIVNAANFTEGQVFMSTLYGSTRTYVATASGWMGQVGPNANNNVMLAMRYD